VTDQGAILGAFACDRCVVVSVVVECVSAVVVVVVFGLADVVEVDAGAENDELGLAGVTEDGLGGSILTAVFAA
jgi:hypothetical protein